MIPNKFPTRDSGFFLPLSLVLVTVWSAGAGDIRLSSSTVSGMGGGAGLGVNLVLPLSLWDARLGAAAELRPSHTTDSVWPDKLRDL